MKTSSVARITDEAKYKVRAERGSKGSIPTLEYISLKIRLLLPHCCIYLVIYLSAGVFLGEGIRGTLSEIITP